MVRLEEIQEAQKRKREAEERNPLLKLNLGELVNEMQKIAARTPSVLTSLEQIKNYTFPKALKEENLKEFEKYTAIVKELDRREKEYQSYKSEPRFG